MLRRRQVLLQQEKTPRRARELEPELLGRCVPRRFDARERAREGAVQIALVKLDERAQEERAGFDSCQTELPGLESELGERSFERAVRLRVYLERHELDADGHALARCHGARAVQAAHSELDGF